MHYCPFNGWPRSVRVTHVRYPEQWAWWRASGWQMIVEDSESGGLLLHSYKAKAVGGSILWGGRVTAEEAASPEQVGRFLTETLYLHLHPRKAAAAVGAVGRICTGKELAAFIRAQQRKVARLLKP